jgi:hypothetical protein
VNRGPDPSSLDRRFARTVVAGDQQNDPLAPGDRLFEPTVDRLPGGVERQSMEVENAIGLDRAGAKPAVPAGVQGASKFALRRGLSCWPGERQDWTNDFA